MSNLDFKSEVEVNNNFNRTEDIEEMKKAEYRYNLTMELIAILDNEEISRNEIFNKIYGILEREQI